LNACAINSSNLNLAYDEQAQSVAEKYSDIPDKKRTPQQLYLNAREAFSMKNELGAKALFIDVRTRAELEFVGVAEGMDVNIPYLFNDSTEWDKERNASKKVLNPYFAEQVENQLKIRGLDKSNPIILICRSGSRSAKAATLLYELGYQKAYTVVDGFEGDVAKEGENKGKRVVNGWKNSRLPWTYQLDKQKMYLEK